MPAKTDDGDRMATPATSGANLVQRIVQWLRAGYPDGVPQQDYVALLGILRRSLTESELTQVVGQLAAEVAQHEQLLTRQLVEQRIQDVVKGPISTDDVIRVSVRLAVAGWPLGSPATSESASVADAEGVADVTGQGLVRRVVDWLRVGYPKGLPDRDYVPLFALLRRRLTEDEVQEVSHRLAAEGVISTDRIDIGTAVAKVTSELATQEDVERVRHYLAEHGWPTDFSM